MESMHPGQGSPQERRYVKETHRLTITGKQLDQDGGTQPIEQAPNIAQHLLDGGLLTCGRLPAGTVGINCGEGDQYVSRNSLACSLLGQQLDIDALTNKPIQVIVFRDGVCQSIDTLQKQPTGERGYCEKDGKKVSIGDSDVTIVLAIGRYQKNGRNDVATNSQKLQTVLGEDLSESVISFADRQGDSNERIGALLAHPNFISLQFKRRQGVRAAEPEQKKRPTLAQTHHVTGIEERRTPSGKLLQQPLPQEVVERIIHPNGNFMIGNMQHLVIREGEIRVDFYRGVDLTVPDDIEGVASRQALIRTEGDFVVLERLEPTGADFSAIDAYGNTLDIPTEKGIVRVKIPDDRPITVTAGFGGFPHLMPPTTGRAAPDESMIQGDRPDSGELPAIGRTNQYMIKIKFTPRKKK
ncbi:MAG: hypothetical protein V1875_06280 [Candidatus Altiarchaeota archaeon]